MTRQRNDDHGTPFSNWLRSEHQRLIGSHTYSCQNLDYIWHNYRENWLITIEEKRFGGMRNTRAKLAQDDTHGVVVQLLKIASGSIVQTIRGPRPAHYQGHYVIVFDNELPGSGMTVNGKKTNVRDLVYLLRRGTLPVSADASNEQ